MKVFVKVLKQAMRDHAILKLRSRLLEKYAQDIKFGPRNIVDQELVEYLYAPMRNKNPSLLRYWFLIFRMYMSGVAYTESNLQEIRRPHLSGEIEDSDSMSFY